MKLRQLYFASLRDVLGEAQVDSFLPGMTVAAFRVALIERTGWPHDRIAPIRAAVNGEFCGEDTPLGDGDELAWIPPVSGG